MAMPLPLSGELSRRRLGTQSGDMMRQARSLQRQGFGRAAEAVALGSAKVRQGEGGIQSAESNVAKQGYAMRLQGGLLESQRRATLLQGAQQDRAMRDAQNDLPSAPFGSVQNGASGVQGAPTRNGSVQNGASGVQGAAPANNLSGGVQTPGLNANPAKPVGVTPPPMTGATTQPLINRVDGNSRDLTGAQAWGGKGSANVAAPAPPRGLIDGKPAADVLAQGRANARSNAPTNLSGDALGVGSLPTGATQTSEQERAGLLSRMRAESSGDTSRTRTDVLDSINQERRRAGQPDVKFSNGEIAAADASVGSLDRSNAVTAAGAAAADAARRTQQRDSEMAMDRAATRSAPIINKTTQSAPAAASQEPPPEEATDLVDALGKDLSSAGSSLASGGRKARRVAGAVIGGSVLGLSRAAAGGVSNVAGASRAIGRTLLGSGQVGKLVRRKLGTGKELKDSTYNLLTGSK